VVRSLCDWLDHRIGYRKLVDAMLLEHIPGGARWRYVWGSCLAFVFAIQVITGVLLMLHYSPGDSTAWGSVYFIQYEMDFGWLIRGLHHFGSQTMVVLLAVHMLQVVVAGAQLPPREFNWWIGLGLLGIVLGLSLTGYLLPWDQKGFYATQVATKIAGRIPIIGEHLQTIVVGGPEYGNHTLTQFFTLHVGILPPLAVVLIIVHLYVFRRHGVTAPAGSRGSEVFWPGQAFRDLAACMLVFVVMVCLVVFGKHGNEIDTGVPRSDMTPYEDWAKAGQKGFGANLDAPADRQTPGYPARPEWYFLFLFQLLKYFEGEQFLVGTVYIPNGVLLVLFLLPLLGYGRMRKFGHAIGILVLVALLGAVCVLTFFAIVDDSETPILGFAPKDLEAAKAFRHRLKEAEEKAKRAVQLAHDGIPQEGGNLLLRNDPATQGPRLFEKNCAACHGKSASDLTGFGTEKWIRGLLKDPSSPKYFGLVKGKDNDGKEELLLTGMIDWRARIDSERMPMTQEQKDEQDTTFDKIARFVADQGKPKDKRDEKLTKEVRPLFLTKCAGCHGFEDYWAKERSGKTPKAPDLTDYGSAEWLRLMIMAPCAKSRYGASATSNHMPAFRPMDGPAAQVPLLEFKLAYPDIEKKPGIVNLPDVDREILIRWLTNDDRVVFGGQPISGVKKK
jgi:ubiquinol-cytochrome c reductase cytochrome b subunit